MLISTISYQTLLLRCQILRTFYGQFPHWRVLSLLYSFMCYPHYLFHHHILTAFSHLPAALNSLAYGQFLNLKKKTLAGPSSLILHRFCCMYSPPPGMAFLILDSSLIPPQVRLSSCSLIWMSTSAFEGQCSSFLYVKHWFWKSSLPFQVVDTLKR